LWRRLGVRLRFRLRLWRRCRRARLAGAVQSADGARSTDLVAIEQTAFEVDAEVAAHYKDLADLAYLAVSKTYLHAWLEGLTGTIGKRDRNASLTTPYTIEPVATDEGVDLGGEANRSFGSRRWFWSWLWSRGRLRRRSTRRGIGNGHSADGVRRTDLGAIEQRSVEIDAEMLANAEDLGDLAHLTIGKAHLNTRLEGIAGSSGVRHGNAGFTAPYAIEPVAAGKAVDLAGEANSRFRSGRWGRCGSFRRSA